MKARHRRDLPNSAWFRTQGAKQRTYLVQRVQDQDDPELFELVVPHNQEVKGVIRLRPYAEMLVRKDAIFVPVQYGKSGHLGECWWPRRDPISELGEPVEGVVVRRARDARTSKPAVEIALFYGDRKERSGQYHLLPPKQARQLMLQLKEVFRED